MDYPAKLLGYRIDTVHSKVVLWEDSPVLNSDTDLERRLAFYRSLEYMGGIAYTYEAVSLAELKGREAAIRADLERQLDHGQGPWDLAIDKAEKLARNHFEREGNAPVLKRLPRAVPIAKSYDWLRLGDRLDTWLIPASEAGKVYMVNGRCTCPDYHHNGVPGGWCKHRLARALAIRAAAIVRNGKAERIEMVVGYAASVSGR